VSPAARRAHLATEQYAAAGIVFTADTRIDVYRDPQGASHREHSGEQRLVPDHAELIAVELGAGMESGTDFGHRTGTAA
jgi:hypothetical protein